MNRYSQVIKHGKQILLINVHEEEDVIRNIPRMIVPNSILNSF
jgi:hypothetical protein